MNHETLPYRLWQYLAGKPALVGGNIQTISHDIAVEDLATAFIHFENGVDGLFQTSNIDAGEGDHVAGDVDPKLGEQLPGKGTDRHTSRRFAGTGPLQNVTGVAPVVLEDTNEIGVPRTRKLNTP